MTRQANLDIILGAAWPADPAAIAMELILEPAALNGVHGHIDAMISADPKTPAKTSGN